MDTLNITHLKKWADLKAAREAFRKKFRNRGDLPYVSVEKLELILEELIKFPLGQHILLTGGANGIWTDYMIAYPWVQSDLSSKALTMNRLEYFILFESLSVIAQRELFLHAQKVAQSHVKEDCVLISVPCGVMRDLLTLDFSQVSNYSLIGVDIDNESLEAAKELAQENEVKNVQFIKQNAWEFDAEGKADFINSIGLNVYESNRERVVALYRQFYKSLKPNGVLFTGVLTYPPGYNQTSDWNLEEISQAHREMDKILVEDVLDLQFNNFRTLTEIKEDFCKAGFTEVEVIPDKYCIFPAVIATKR